jgi:hypothetical protein
MSDRLRADPTPTPDGLSAAERNTRVEQLLLTGLDHYFAGQYDRAVSVWTRVLFLDRGHARAKAYIERARGAIGERQRESDELLHRGVDAFNRGETDKARDLLNAVVERGGSQEVALSFLERMSRLERPLAQIHAQVSGHRRRPALRSVVLTGERRRRAWALPGVIVALMAVAFFYIQSSRERTAPFLFLLDWRGGGSTASMHLGDDPLPVPRAAEIDLDRARMLLAQGHARDALRLLDRIGPADPLVAEAADLREDIQRVLLSEFEGGTLVQPTPAPPGTPASRDQ